MKDNNRVTEIVNNEVYQATTDIERAKSFFDLLCSKYSFNTPNAPQADSLEAKVLFEEWGLINNVCNEITEKLQRAIETLDSIKITEE